MTIRQLWNAYKSSLESISSSAESDFQWLIRAALNQGPVHLSLDGEKALQEPQLTEARAVLNRRASGEPVAYILGEWDFCGRTFKVGPGVLVPRADTESLIDLVKERFAKKTAFRFCDFGSGSGCLAITLAIEFLNSSGVAIERSSQAFSYLRTNAKALLEDVSRVELENESVEKFVFESEPSLFDVVVANPPYIEKGDNRVEVAVDKYEPKEALYAEERGLAAIRKWAESASKVLVPNGVFISEFGQGQGQDVLEIVTSLKNFCKVEIRNDLSGQQRFVVCQKSEKEISKHG
jgi:release factor glutamine methyltransferase